MKVPTGHFGIEASALGATVTMRVAFSGTRKPATVSAAIDRISAPGTRRTTSTGVSTIPASVISTAGELSGPSAM
jgi:hypothetical protein